MIRRTVLVLMLLAAIATAASAAPAELIADVPNRHTISLNGAWRHIVDPFDSGRGGHFYNNAKPRDSRDLVEYDFGASPVLNVPGDWNSQREALFFYEGTVWYQRTFLYRKAAEKKRVFLYFGAAANRATVYLNGTKLGEHEGGYTPFNFEVTETLRDGENSVVVAVNNQRRPEAVPSLSTDWWNYGGLTRDVMLVEVPEVFVESFAVQLAKGSKVEIAGWVRLNGATAPQPVTLEIPEAGVKQSATTDARGYAEFRFPAKVQLWSPEDPKLYRVAITAAADKVEDQIGFRAIETRGSQILLNGKPVILRGISIHEEAPYRGGRAFSADDGRTLLTWAKELGCNYVRLAHYPHNENMTRLADRMGLMVWSEVPVYWDTDWANPATLQNARDQLRENIARDQNRAAVIFWSVANETPINDGRNAFLKNLAAYARQLDGTRLITAALNRTNHTDPLNRVINDPIGESLDVLGLNEYFAWYEGRLEDLDKLRFKNAYDKPLLISEFGAEAPAGHHGDPGAIWTEEYQAVFYQRQIAMARQIPSFAGLSPWVLMDFRSPRRLLPGMQDYRNRKGLVSDRGERKKAFYVLRDFYGELSGAPKP